MGVLGYNVSIKISSVKKLRGYGFESLRPYWKIFTINKVLVENILK